MGQEEKQLSIIIISTLIVQFLCRYYSQHFQLKNGFQSLIFILRFCVPFLIVVFYLKISWKNMGIRVPEISRKGCLYLAGIIAAVPACLYAIKFNSSYQHYYGSISSLSARQYMRFALFTLSTIPAWEFLHRGFLLFGINNTLNRENTSQAKTPTVVPILVVMVFETLYHFTKPGMEAGAMLIVSPVFSLIAIRTRSIFIPLLIHLYIEFWFIIYIST
jgi:membrane protease YdiL (CAAX protease family)